MKYKRKRQLKKNFKKSLRKSLINDILLLSTKDADKLSSRVPPIIDTDYLFQSSDNPLDSYTNNSFSNNEIMMPMGYINTACLLLRIVKYSKSNLVKDSYIFPALFCFRQYLELIMKDSILKFRNGRSELTRGECKLDSHNLFALWNDLKNYIANKKTKEVRNIERLIKELYDYDDNSEAFRYDYKFNQNNSITPNKKLNQFIDLEILETRMLQLYRFFEGINSEAYVFNETSSAT